MTKAVPSMWSDVRRQANTRRHINHSHHQEELVLLSAVGFVFEGAFFDGERLSLAKHASSSRLHHGGPVHWVFPSIEVPKYVVQEGRLWSGISSAGGRARKRRTGRVAARVEDVLPTIG